MDRTREYYESMSDDYARKTFHLSMEHAAKRFIESLQPKSLVVDLGCGSGRDLCLFSNAGHNPIGMDYAESMVRIARRLSTCDVVVGDIRAIPFKENSFSGAWASASFLHLKRKFVLSALEECHRVLKDGGVFWASVKHGNGEEVDSTGRWFTYFLVADWETHLRESGFVNISSFVEDAPNSDDGNVPWINSISYKPHA